MGTNYTQISCEDRAMIQWGLGQGWTQRAIARCVDRSPSTVSRELRRNGWRNPADKSPPIGRPRKVPGYHAVTAQQRANKLAVKARRRRFRPGAPLWDTVTRLLRTKHSPEQICGILRRMHPYARALHLSHETIYTALYALPRGTLRSELVASLRQSRKRRRPRARGNGGLMKIPMGCSDSICPKALTYPGSLKTTWIRSPGNLTTQVSEFKLANIRQ